ncbi:hypothetical protein N2152v2_009587 [Parachlorella kessleri]
MNVFQTALRLATVGTGVMTEDSSGQPVMVVRVMNGEDRLAAFYLASNYSTQVFGLNIDPAAQVLPSRVEPGQHYPPLPALHGFVDTFESIAATIGTDVSALQSANPGVDPAKLAPGQVIGLPVGAKGCHGGVAGNSSGCTYTIKQEDSYFKLAAARNTTIEAIQAVNPGVDYTKLQIGQVINLPVGATNCSGGGNNGLADCKYTIKSGCGGYETVWPTGMCTLKYQWQLTGGGAVTYYSIATNGSFTSGYKLYLSLDRYPPLPPIGPGGVGQCPMLQTLQANSKGLPLGNGTMPSLEECCAACQALQDPARPCNEFIYCAQQEGVEESFLTGHVAYKNPVQQGPLPAPEDPNEQCLMAIEPHTDGKGAVVANGTAKDVGECCQSCQAHMACNVFVYCNSTEGKCNATAGCRGSTVPTLYPHGTCTLKYEDQLAKGGPRTNFSNAAAVPFVTGYKDYSKSLPLPANLTQLAAGDVQVAYSPVHLGNQSLPAVQVLAHYNPSIPRQACLSAFGQQPNDMKAAVGTRGSKATAAPPDLVELICNGSYSAAANGLAELVLQGGSAAEQAVAALKQAHHDCSEQQYADVYALEMLLTAFNTQSMPADRVRGFVNNLVTAADGVGLPMCINVDSVNMYGDRENKNSGQYYTGSKVPLQTGGPDKQALLQFKDSLSNGAAVLSDWSGDSNNTCQWSGITCDANASVVGMHLSGRNLIGTIPASGWTLPPSLQALNVSHNRIYGTLPSSWTLPAHLAGLDLSSNQLSGSLPANWALPGLELAQLDNNQLAGSLPGWQAPGNASVVVGPQSRMGLCGTVPSAPQFYSAGFQPLAQPLPDCPAAPDKTSSVGGGGGSGAAVGIAVGVAGGAAALAVVGLVVWRRRRRRMQSAAAEKSTQEEAGEVKGEGGAPSQLPPPSPWQAGAVQNWLVEAGLVKPLGGSAVNTPFAPTTPGHDRARGASVLPLGPSTSSGSHSQESSGLQRDQVLALAVQAARSPEAESISLARQSSSTTSPRSPLADFVKTWTINFDDLELTRKIGEGSFGRVYLAKWQETPVAVKILLNTGIDVLDADSLKQVLTLSNPLLINLQKECALLATLRHPNVVGFMGVCAVPPCVVTEYCARGSLTDVLRQAKQSPAAQLDWVKRLNMMLDTAKGMLHLHSHKPPIIHRDLKSPNLLVDSHWHVKVSDFNLSKASQPFTKHKASRPAGS